MVLGFPELSMILRSPAAQFEPYLSGSGLVVIAVDRARIRKTLSIFAEALTP